MPYRTVNPATGQTVATFEQITDEAIAETIDVAQSCFKTEWRHRPVAERAGVVRTAARLMRDRQDVLAGLLTLEMGKLIAEARAEVGLSADILDYYADRAEAYLAPAPIPEVPNATVETLPLGVILAVEPWNFPYYQLARVAGPQLMVGNVLIVKHASNVPQSALAFAKIIEDAGAPTGCYTNVFASTDQVAHLIDDIRVRGVTVTGSERAGAAVAERAGRALKKSVMELGGSDPLIVLVDAPVEPTLANAIWGRMKP